MTHRVIYLTSDDVLPGWRLGTRPPVRSEEDQFIHCWRSLLGLKSIVISTHTDLSWILLQLSSYILL